MNIISIKRVENVFPFKVELFVKHRVKFERCGDEQGKVGISDERKWHPRDKLSRKKVILDGNLHIPISSRNGFLQWLSSRRSALYSRMPSERCNAGPNVDGMNPSFGW